MRRAHAATKHPKKHNNKKTNSLHDPDAGVLQLGVAPLEQALLVSQGRDGVIKCWQPRPDGALGR